MRYLASCVCLCPDLVVALDASQVTVCFSFEYLGITLQKANISN